jgi:TetR/AcrR family transcriptional repressor of nem operon
MKMAKGAETREEILQRAAVLFNTKGYTGAALSDIMDATGLKKGGIYNHFESKESLAIAAFDHAMAVIGASMQQALSGKVHARERLRALLDFFESYSRNPPIPGGCPIMNTAIENDDGNPELRDRAKRAMESWRQFIARTVRRGVERGELRKDADAEQAATIFIATIEGSILMSKLYRDSTHIDRALAHLRHYLEEEL